MVDDVKQMANVLYGEIIPSLEDFSDLIGDFKNRREVCEYIRDYYFSSIEHCSYEFKGIPLKSHNMESRWSLFIYEWMLSNDTYQCTGKQLVDLACVLLRLAWNFFSWKRGNMELSKVEMLNVLSIIVVKLANDKRPGTLVSVPTSPSCFSIPEWIFLKGRELLSVNSRYNQHSYLWWIKSCLWYFSLVLIHHKDLPNKWMCNDSHIYSAALHYACGLNDIKALKQCFEVVSPTDNPKEHRYIPHSHLLFMDEVANACGFGLLYNHIVDTHKSKTVKVTFHLSRECVLKSLARFLQKRMNMLPPLMKDQSKPRVFSRLPLDNCLMAICFHKRSTETCREFQMH